MTAVLEDRSPATLRDFARDWLAEHLPAGWMEAVDRGDADAAARATAAKIMASESAVWAVELASRLAASRSYTGDTELARLRRDAPQTQIGEGANDALLIAAGKAVIKARKASR